MAPQPHYMIPILWLWCLMFTLGGQIREVVMSGEWVPCLICADCAQWQANGECLVVGGEAEMSAVADVQGLWTVGDHHGFSHSRCEACRRPWAGDRYEAHQWLEEF